MCKNLEMTNKISIDGFQIIDFIDITENEKEMVLSWRNNNKIRNSMFNQHIIKYKEHNSFIEKLRKDKKNKYWLIKNIDNQYLGVIYLNNIDLTNKSAYIGLYVNPSKIGKGIGKILMDCLKKAAFDHICITNLIAEVVNTNFPAINLYKSSGFKQITQQKIFNKAKYLMDDVMIMENHKE